MTGIQELLNALGLGVIDVIAILLILILVIKGLTTGFLKQIVGVLSLLFSVVIAKILNTGLTLKLVELFNVHGLLEEKVRESVVKAVGETVLQTGVTASGVCESVLGDFGFISQLFSKFMDSDKVLKSLEVNVGKVTKNTTDVLTTEIVNIVEPIVVYVVGVIVLLLTFIILKLIISFLLSQVVDVFSTLPLVGAANALIGGALGLIKGVCIVVLGCSVLFLIVSVFNNFLGITMDTLTSSKVYTFFNEYKNYIIK